MSNLSKILPFLKTKVAQVKKDADTNQDGKVSGDEAMIYISNNPEVIMVFVFAVIGWIWPDISTVYDTIIEGNFEWNSILTVIFKIALPALITLMYRYYSKKFTSKEQDLVKALEVKLKEINTLKETIMENKHKFELELLRAQDECRIMQTALKTKDLEIELLNEKLKKIA